MKTKTIVILALIVVLFLTKKKTGAMQNESEKNYSLEDAKQAWNAVKEKYPKEFSSKLEKLFRLETAHFTSGQFRKSGSAGMVAIKDDFPYGWGSLTQYLNSGEAIDSKTENYGLVSFMVRGKEFKYITFPNLVDSILFTAWFIKNKRNGNFAAWYSLNPASQATYNAKLQNVRTPFTNSLYL